MSQTKGHLNIQTTEQDEKSAVPRHIKQAFFIFFIGGMPALIYQVVWQRVLTLYFGVDIYSTTVAVTAFMFGLGIGSFIGGWLADRYKSAVAIYAVVELVIGAFGLISLGLFSFVGAKFAGSSLGVLIVVDSLLLLFPTCLMGMTLPLMTRIAVENSEAIGSRLSWLYGLNTLGAAIGALISAYLLIGLLGFTNSVIVSAILNGALGVSAYLFLREKRVVDDAPVQLAESSSESPQMSDDLQIRISAKAYLMTISLFAFLSGFIALSYEIVWYRIMSILLHGTAYVFGTVLFIFLLGIASGSLFSERSISRPGWLRRFAFSQFAIALYVWVIFNLLGNFSGLPGVKHLISASFFTTFHPNVDIDMAALSLASAYSILDIVFWSFTILFPPSFMMGYGFPNLMRAGSLGLQNLGVSVGRIYFTNIVGSTAGSLLTGFILLHYLGTELTLRLMIVLGLAVSGYAILFERRAMLKTQTSSRKLIGVFTATGILMVAFFPVSGQLIKSLHLGDFDSVEFDSVEDRTGIVALRKQSEIIAFPEEEAVLNTELLYIDGSRHGGFEAVAEANTAYDVHAFAMFSAIKMPKKLRVLSIGLGDGKMVSAASNSKNVDEIIVIELNGSLAKLLEKSEKGDQMRLFNPKIKHVNDDGRRWLLANKNEKFDVVLMWPLHAAHAHSGSLYSKEFLSIITDHLTEGGVLFLRTSDFFSTPKTLASVFHEVRRLGNEAYIAGNSDNFSDFDKSEELAKLITANRKVIMENTKDAPLNLDFSPNSEYYLTYSYRKYLKSSGRPPY